MHMSVSRRSFVAAATAGGLAAAGIAAALNSSSALASASSSSAGSSSADSTQSVELTMLVPGYDGGYLKDELDAGVAGFEKANPNIKITLLSVGWDDLNSRIVQLYQAGDAPDIMLTGSRSLRQLVEMGALEDLTPYLTDDFVDARVESVFKTAELNGKQYGVPMAFSSRALIYRSDLIETAPTNWDELLETAKTVHSTHEGVYGFALPTDTTSGADELLNFFYQNEGRMVDDDGNYTLNSDANVETLEYLAQYGSEKNLIPDAVSTARSDQITYFKNGNLAMFITGPWDREDLEANQESAPFKVAQLPKGKVLSETLVTDSYVVSSLSEHKEAAWKFLEFMAQPEYQRPVSEAYNWFPVLKAEIDDERFQDEFMKPFAALIEYGVPEPSTPNWDNFNKNFLIAVQKALTSEATAQDALDEAQKELEA